MIQVHITYFKMSKLQLETVSFNIGSIQADGYTANQLDANGNYINYLSGTGMANMIELTHSTTEQKRLSKELKAMLGAGFATVQGKAKMKSGGVSSIECWTTLQAATFFQYHATKGNKKAVALLIALGSTTLDTIINDEFNRVYAQHQAKKITGLRFKTVETFLEAREEILGYINSNNLQGTAQAQFMYSNYSDGINRGLFGMPAKKIREQLGINSKTKLIRDHFGETALRRIDLVQTLSSALIVKGTEPVQAVKDAINIYGYNQISFTD